MVPQLTRTRHKSPTYREQLPIMVPPMVPLFPYITPLVTTYGTTTHSTVEDHSLYYSLPWIAYQSPGDVVQWCHQLSLIFVTLNKCS